MGVLVRLRRVLVLGPREGRCRLCMFARLLLGGLVVAG